MIFTDATTQLVNRAKICTHLHKNLSSKAIKVHLPTIHKIGRPHQSHQHRKQQTQTTTTPLKALKKCKVPIHHKNQSPKRSPWAFFIILYPQQFTIQVQKKFSGLCHVRTCFCLPSSFCFWKTMTRIIP